MQERILEAAVGGLRLVLVVVALATAALPIARGATTGFCPSGGEADGIVLAAPAAPLAAAVSPTDGSSLSDGVAPTDGGTAPTDGGTGGPTDAPSTPVRIDDGTPGEEEVGPCGPGVDRCLPPLVSAVVSLGGGACGAEAVDILQGSMVPAFLISSLLLVGAWLLRPRHGEPVVSRR